MESNLPPLSYSFLSDEANCPRKAYHRYVARDLPREAPSEAQLYGTLVHKAFEKRINEGSPLPDELANWEPVLRTLLGRASNNVLVRAEVMGALDKNERVCNYWDKSRCAFRCKLDVAVIDEGGASAHILDWKTGKVREDPFELEIQGYILKKYWVGLETITGQYVWLKENKLGKLHDVSDTERTANSIRSQMTEMERRGDWPARPNPLCGWCPVATCEHNPAQGRRSWRE